MKLPFTEIENSVEKVGLREIRVLLWSWKLGTFRYLSRDVRLQLVICIWSSEEMSELEVLFFIVINI